MKDKTSSTPGDNCPKWCYVNTHKPFQMVDRMELKIKQKHLPIKCIFFQESVICSKIYFGLLKKNSYLNMAEAL